MEGPRSSPAGPTGSRRYGRLGSLRHTTDNFGMRGLPSPAIQGHPVLICESEVKKPVVCCSLGFDVFLGSMELAFPDQI